MNEVIQRTDSEGMVEDIRKNGITRRTDSAEDRGMVEGKWTIRRKDKNEVIQRTDSGMAEGRGMTEGRESMDGMTTSVVIDTGENANILRTDPRRRNDAPLPRAEEDKHPPHPPITVRTHKNPFEVVRERADLLFRPIEERRFSFQR